MNLVEDAWIPAVDLAGVHRSVSLREAFEHGDTLADLAANPCQRIALTRLLLCIAQAALEGPADEEHWLACRARLAGVAVDYLARWEHRFNLFGPQAFLQVDALAPERNTLADKIDLSRSSGNNPTLFDHGASPEGRVPTPAKLALDVLVYQVYSPGGLIGRVIWDGKETEKSCELAPALEGSLLHTIIRGATLLETIHANLLTRTQVIDWGRPSWELDRLLRRELQQNAPTYLGRLVPVTRALRCIENSPELTLASAVAYPKLPEGREPMATVVLRKRGAEEAPAYVAVSLAKHPWRELGAVLSLTRADGYGGALAMTNLRTLPSDHVDIWTGGLAANKSKLLDMAEWCFSLPRVLLDDFVLARYRRGVTYADAGDAALRAAVKVYATELKAEAALWQSVARSRYWAALDASTGVLVEAATDPGDDLAAWMSSIRSTMGDAYERTCPSLSPRQTHAYVLGLRKLIVRQAREQSHDQPSI